MSEEEFFDCVDKPFLEKQLEQVVQEISDNSKEDVESSVIEALGDKDIEKAIKFKEEGNLLFTQKDFDSAIQLYSQAIYYCPEDNKDLLSTYYGNRSAAYFAEGEYELTIDDCSSSLELKPDYIKVLGRRMQAYEKLDKLEEALADANKIIELDSAFPKIHESKNRIQKAYDEKISKLKDEALGKLKDLGNSILGNFGLSLDNFKMTQDPSTGGWSIK